MIELQITTPIQQSVITVEALHPMARVIYTPACFDFLRGKYLTQVEDWIALDPYRCMKMINSREKKEH